MISGLYTHLVITKHIAEDLDTVRWTQVLQAIDIASLLCLMHCINLCMAPT